MKRTGGGTGAMCSLSDCAAAAAVPSPGKNAAAASRISPKPSHQGVRRPIFIRAARSPARAGTRLSATSLSPQKALARILIEAKGYGATGSKMTDILGDIRDIVAAKRPDTAFLFFTDGITWKERPIDLRQIVEFQNNGDITRIYTYAMTNQFEADLRQLKAEYKL